MQIDLFISVISTLRDGSMFEERRMLIDSGAPVTGASVPEDAVAQLVLVSPDLPLSSGPHVRTAAGQACSREAIREGRS